MGPASGVPVCLPAYNVLLRRFWVKVGVCEDDHDVLVHREPASVGSMYDTHGKKHKQIMCISRAEPTPCARQSAGGPESTLYERSTHAARAY